MSKTSLNDSKSTRSRLDLDHLVKESILAAVNVTFDTSTTP